MATQQRNARKRNAAPYQTTTAQREDNWNERRNEMRGEMRGEEDGTAHGTDGQPSWSAAVPPEGQNGQQNEEMDDYAMKRLRNNAAVSRTRQKKRMEQVHTSQRVRELREENAQLERTLDTMRRELALLKEMVVVCAAKGDDVRGRS
ncbi:hypothetical protein niasHT_004973 [Heterodera trifolii]|uniref:BZIP domain-containing protein n=1 Tax=Heterodera trifolii TaxID=157864 RepID=A0ABD2M4N3_9BILA